MGAAQAVLVKAAVARPWRGLWMRDRNGVHRQVVFVVFRVIFYRHLFGSERGIQATSCRRWQKLHKKGARVIASDLGR